jgi:hypothetical protein
MILLATLAAAAALADTNFSWTQTTTKPIAAGYPDGTTAAREHIDSRSQAAWGGHRSNGGERLADK